MRTQFDKYYAVNEFNPEQFEWVDFFDSSLPVYMIHREVEYLFDGTPIVSVVMTDEKSHTGQCLDMIEAGGYGDFEGRCQHCGARIKYCCIYRDTENGELIVVGETCAANRMGLTVDEFQIKREKQRKQAIKSRQERIEKMQAFLTPEYVDLIAYIKAQSMNNDFMHSLLHQFERDGSLTDNQVAAAIKYQQRQIEWERQKAKDAANATAVPEGKGIHVQGVVISRKWKETQYGDVLKMIVRSDDGFKVWGTVPSSVMDIESGDRVDFIANLEQSRDDETFGFFKRPRKASFIQQVSENETH